MLGIMAGLDQKDSYAVFPASGMYKAGIAGDIAPRAVLSSLVGRPKMLRILVANPAARCASWPLWDQKNRFVVIDGMFGWFCW